MMIVEEVTTASFMHAKKLCCAQQTTVAELSFLMMNFNSGKKPFSVK